MKWNLGLFRQKIKEQNQWVSHTLENVEVEFDYVDEDTVMVFLYKNNNQITEANLSVPGAFKVYKEVDEEKSCEGPAFKWRSAIERIKVEDEEDF